MSSKLPYEPKIGDLVAVEWTDTWSEDKWEATDDLEMTLPHILTVGFVMGISDDAYAISQAVGMSHPGDEAFCDVYGTSRIPRAIINGIYPLRLPARVIAKLPKSKPKVAEVKKAKRPPRLKKDPPVSSEPPA